MSHRVGIPPTGKAPPRCPPPSLLCQSAPPGRCGAGGDWNQPVTFSLPPRQQILPLRGGVSGAKLTHCSVQCYVINTMLQFNEKLINKYVVLFR